MWNQHLPMLWNVVLVQILYHVIFFLLLIIYVLNPIGPLPQVRSAVWSNLPLSITSVGKQRSDAIRTEPILLDVDGRTCWRLRGYSDEPKLLLQGYYFDCICLLRIHLRVLDANPFSSIFRCGILWRSWVRWKMVHIRCWTGKTDGKIYSCYKVNTMICYNCKSVTCCSTWSKLNTRVCEVEMFLFSQMVFPKFGKNIS